MRPAITGTRMNMEDKKECYHPIPEEYIWYWDKIGHQIECPDCGILCVIEYDEWYDEEANDEYQYWYLTAVE